LSSRTTFPGEPSPDQRPLADARAVHHHAVDADQAAVAHGAAVQHGLVADGDAIAQGERETGIHVQHGAVLHVGRLANAHHVVLGANHHLEPDIGVRFQRDGAHQGRVVRDVVVRAAQLDAFVADRIKSHGGPL
jgi:hypothetical protein